jgi:hypothetical protein
MYLVAYCHKAEEIRTFAVERIVTAEVLDETFEADPAFDAASFTRKGFGVFHGPVHQIVVDFSPRVAHLIRERRYHATQQVADRGRGVRLKMEAAGLPENSGVDRGVRWRRPCRLAARAGRPGSETAPRRRGRDRDETGRDLG